MLNFNDGKEISVITPIMNPKEIVERGEQIYRDMYQEAYEREHDGKFVAIDVRTKNAYVGDSPEAVLKDARDDAPQGLFHLIKVGSAGAFRVSYSNNATVDWIFT